MTIEIICPVVLAAVTTAVWICMKQVRRLRAHAQDLDRAWDEAQVAARHWNVQLREKQEELDQAKLEILVLRRVVPEENLGGFGESPLVEMAREYMDRRHVGIGRIVGVDPGRIDQTAEVLTDARIANTAQHRGDQITNRRWTPRPLNEEEQNAGRIASQIFQQNLLLNAGNLYDMMGIQVPDEDDQLVEPAPGPPAAAISNIITEPGEADELISEHDRRIILQQEDDDVENP